MCFMRHQIYEITVIFSAENGSDSWVKARVSFRKEDYAIRIRGYHGGPGDAGDIAIDDATVRCIKI